MRIEDSALYVDIADVINNNNNPTRFRYTVQVTTPDGVAVALKMESLEENKDYLTTYADETTLIAWFVEHDYLQYIEPNQQNLDVCIIRNTLSILTGQKPVIKRYKASLHEATTPGIGDTDGPDRDPQLAMKRLTFQLFDRALFELRMKTVSGIYRSATAADTLLTILDGASRNIDVDNDVKPLGVDFVPSDTRQLGDGKLNTRANLIVRGGIRLYDLPGYFQRHCGGIYNNGIGCYYTNRMWYVYPLFDNGRFGNTDRGLTILRIPANAFPDIDHSYKRYGNHTVVLGTGDALDFNKVDHAQLNEGNAVVYGTAKGVFNSPSTDPSGFTSEPDVLGRLAIDPRPDGLNNTRYDVGVVTDNNAMMVSQLAARTQQLYQFGWAYADIDLLFPGQPVQICYVDRGKVAELMGTLVRAEAFTELEASRMTTQGHRTKVALTILANTRPENVI